MAEQGSAGRAIVNLDRQMREGRGEKPDEALEVEIAFINTATGSGHRCRVSAPNGMRNVDIREFLVKLSRGKFPNLEQSRGDLDITMKNSKVSEDILQNSLVEWRQSVMGGALFPEGEKWALLSRTYFYFFHKNGAVATLEDFRRMRR
jgi:hypothetical protein